LQIEVGATVVLRDRISYDQNDQPFEVLHSVDRGDKFVYHYMSANDWKIEPDKAVQK
jgi:DNA-binding GntR family transcriptional regulator